MHDDKKRVCLADLQGKLSIEAIDIVAIHKLMGYLLHIFLLETSLLTSAWMLFNNSSNPALNV